MPRVCETGLLGERQDDLVLHLRGDTIRDRFIRIRHPKCFVGSAAHCDLRLDLSDILPVHCLILRGTHGVAIRSFSDDLRVNGHTQRDAMLQVADCVSLGSIELEVISDASAIDTPPSSSGENVLDEASPNEPSRPDGSCPADRTANDDGELASHAQPPEAEETSDGAVLPTELPNGDGAATMRPLVPHGFLEDELTPAEIASVEAYIADLMQNFHRG